MPFLVVHPSLHPSIRSPILPSRPRSLVVGGTPGAGIALRELFRGERHRLAGWEGGRDGGGRGEGGSREIWGGMQHDEDVEQDTGRKAKPW